jgi:hypothetical protein
VWTKRGPGWAAHFTLDPALPAELAGQSGYNSPAMMDVGVVTWLVGLVRDYQQNRRRVRVLVHHGVLLAAPWQMVDPAQQAAVTGTGQPPHGEPPLYYFIKVTNSAKREVEVSHVWVEGSPSVPVMLPQRPLPSPPAAPLTMGRGWVPVQAVGHIPEPEWQVRVRLSHGHTVKSRPNRDVPPVGYVAGPGTRLRKEKSNGRSHAASCPGRYAGPQSAWWGSCRPRGS